MFTRFSGHKALVIASGMVAVAVLALSGVYGARATADEGDAQAEASVDLSGTWRRVQPASSDEDAGEAPAPRYYVFDDAGSEVLGRLLEESLDSFTRYDIRLRRTTSGKISGTASWEDSYEEGGKAYTFSTETRWELSLESPDLLKGRMEFVDWDLSADPNVLTGEELERGWTDYEFRRLPRVD